MTVKNTGGETFAGYIISETDSSVTLRLPGGVSQEVPAKNIASREDMPLSLMPPGLAATLAPQEFVDLIAYLQSLK